MKWSKEQRNRPGFTIAEMVLAFSILALVMVLVAQASVWSFGERQRNSARQAAVELAENVLQAARSRPWEDLAPAWAAAQKLPKEWQDTFPDGLLSVQIQPEKGLPNVKRVTTTVRWRAHAGSVPPMTIEMSALFSKRSAAGKGDK
jgi:type II secretory pathway pseudopilin PulG